MNIKLLFLLLTSSLLISSELQIKANIFHADENTGTSVFQGDVNIVKDNDELNASKVIVKTNKDKQPVKFIATGDVSFVIETEKKSLYRGKAQRVVYMPKQKEYRFYKNVHLEQVDDKKIIIGDEVVLKTIEGKAYAKGMKSEPVIMIFKLSDENTTKGK
jgi:lipopolysaccharide export system protein LptA